MKLVHNILLCFFCLSGVASGAVFTWDANIEADLSAYRLYQCSASPCAKGQGTQVGQIPKGTQSFFLVDPPAGGFFSLAAVDTANNESDRSNTVTLPPLADTTAPNAPGHLAIAYCSSFLGPCVDIAGGKYGLTQQDPTLGGWKLSINGVVSGCADNAALRIGNNNGHLQSQQGPKACDGTASPLAGHWFDYWNGTWTDVGL